MNTSAFIPGGFFLHLIYLRLNPSYCTGRGVTRVRRRAKHATN